jgi:hypothetical protein
VVPVFGRGGMPVRLELLTTVSLSVLFAFGAAHLGRWAARENVALGMGFAFAMAIIPNLEYRNLPMPLEKVPSVPAIFETIRQEPPEVAIFADEDRRTQFEQISHGHPITYARLSRLPVREHPMVMMPLYQILMFRRGSPGAVSDADAQGMREYLKEHRLKYYISHSYHPQIRQFVEEKLGGEVVHVDAERMVYRFTGVN